MRRRPPFHRPSARVTPEASRLAFASATKARQCHLGDTSSAANPDVARAERARFSDDAPPRFLQHKPLPHQHRRGQQLVEIAHDNGISLTFHINEAPMMLSKSHFKHLHETTTYIRIGRLPDGRRLCLVVAQSTNTPWIQNVDSIPAMQNLKWSCFGVASLGFACAWQRMVDHSDRRNITPLLCISIQRDV